MLLLMGVLWYVVAFALKTLTGHLICKKLWDTLWQRVRHNFLQSAGEVSMRLSQVVFLFCFVLTVCKKLWRTHEQSGKWP